MSLVPNRRGMRISRGPRPPGATPAATPGIESSGINGFKAKSHSGNSCEWVKLEGNGGSHVYLALDVGRATVIEELEPNVWIKSDRPGPYWPPASSCRGPSIPTPAGP